MVELRPNIAGFYKGYIFCSGLKQANQISAHVNEVLEKRIGSGLSSTVKRGCSEYPISFPDYKEINNSGAEVPNATIVRPIINLEIPNFFETLIAPLRRKSPDKSKTTNPKPATRKL